MEPGPHTDLLASAVRADGEAFRALYAGREAEARERLLEAARLYRASYEVAPPRSYGRLVACLKAAIMAGEAGEAATWVRGCLGDACDSPTSCYALAVAALASGEDALAARAAEGMREGDGPFQRAAGALAALAARDGAAYAEAVQAIVADFETREDHLTGVPIADTALMLEALAAGRGMAARPASRLMPAVG